MEGELKQCNPSGWRTAWLACMATAALLQLLPLAPGSGFAQEVIVTPEGVVSSPAPDAALQAQATLEYWTRERMRQAIPMPIPSAAPKGAVVRERALPAGVSPRLAPGWKPGSGPQPGADALIEITPDHPLYPEAMGYAQPQTSPPFLDPPANPTDYANYAPFNRWTWFGNYLTYPTSTIGKLFFKQNGVNYVCSGSVIQKNTISTAGHCVNDGAGHWSSNFLFCPSYWKNAAGVGEPYPTRGCWAGLSANTLFGWVSGDIDYDIGCIVTNPTNTTTSQPVGNVTGWTGVAYGWLSRQSIFSWGYPAASPFPGYHIIITASTEWYEVDMTEGGAVSKYIGSDQTGGCSGGPWWYSLRHPNISNEYADTDGSDLTDPGQGAGPFLNGINSHKRCTQAGCPPGTSFTQEMGSPEFSVGASNVFNACFNGGGS